MDESFPESQPTWILALVDAMKRIGLRWTVTV
jgi:hypothetical protein